MKCKHNKKVSLVSPLDYDECVGRLKENIQTKLLAGSVKRNVFYLICYRRNPLKPTLIMGMPTYFYGKLSQWGEKTKIEGVYRVPTYLKITFLN